MREGKRKERGEGERKERGEGERKERGGGGGSASEQAMLLAFTGPSSASTIILS